MNPIIRIPYSYDKELSDILEFIYLQFESGVFVCNEHGQWMVLEGRDGPHVIHSALNRHVQSKGLVSSSYQDHYLIE